MRRLAVLRLFQIEMTRLEWSFIDLHAGLERFGVTDENEHNLRNEVASSTFSAVFLARSKVTKGQVPWRK